MKIKMQKIIPFHISVFFFFYTYLTEPFTFKIYLNAFVLIRFLNTIFEKLKIPQVTSKKLKN